MSHIACVPLIEADISAVLALDQRCLGGLWTRSGYQRELESECSDLLVLLAGNEPGLRLRSVPNPVPGPVPGSVPGSVQTDISASKPHRKKSEPSIIPDTAGLPAANDPTHIQPSKQNSERQSEQAEPPITLLGTGCLWAILEEAHITTLAIEPAYQGQKLGQLLLSELLLHGRRRGLTRATLEVRLSNARALGLYQKFGFKEAGQRKRYYSDGENARILWRSGLQTEAFLAQITEQKQAAIARLSTHYTTELLSP